MNDKENIILPAWSYKRAAGAVFAGAFAEAINDALVKGAESGATSVSVKLPPAYRPLNKRAKKLREQMESALTDRGYTLEYRRKGGAVWWGHDDVSIDDGDAEKRLRKKMEEGPFSVEIMPKTDY